MRTFEGSALILSLALAVAGGISACSDDAAGKLSRGAAGANDGADGGDPNGTNGSLTHEEELFRALEGDLAKKCGGACHVDGTYKPQPPTFLAGPDAYKSIKSSPGIVTKDTYQSALLTKGAHAGPAINADADFEKRVVEWLDAESLAIRSQRLPSTDPITITQGPNDVDLSKACTSGLAGVHITFDASVVGGLLEFSNIKINAPAGSDVHILRPKFIKILAAAGADGSTEVADPADTFSNTDQTIPNGTQTVLSPGTALFTSPKWSPFELGTAKIRIEFEKLEPGKVQIVTGPVVCKNVANFTANILPSMRGQAGGFSLNCSSCHGNGLAGMSLNNADQTLVCNQVLAKLNKADIGNSLIVTKVSAGPHQGGIINDPTAWRTLFVNNAGVFF